MIKEAAIQRISDGKVWTGRRHGNVIHKIVEETGIRPVGRKDFIQGFVTDSNIFVDRIEAFKIAVECNQLLDKEDPWGPPTLFSEDLY
jgi:hypothetical protein